MEFIHVLILALLQGFTEFLPISSSAHLILLPKLAGWQDQGLAFDVIVHVGTLGAVMFYFRKELSAMTTGWWQSIRLRKQCKDSRLAWAVIIGTIPVGLLGLMLSGYVETVLRNPLIIAAATIVFGLLLWWADVKGKRQRSEYSLTMRDIIIIGCAQAVALVPGTSRSGITITAGLLLGLTRSAAARFSFLLSIPVILISGLLKSADLMQSGQSVEWTLLLAGLIISGITAYICIFFFLKLLDRISMLPFVIYRLILGGLLLKLYL